MTKSAKIRDVIKEILEDGEVHTANQILQECLNRGIITMEENALVRATIYHLKNKNIGFVTVSRGKYQWIKENEQQDKNELGNKQTFINNFDDTIQYLNNKISCYKKFNWVSCDDKELVKARREVKALKELANRIETI